MNIITCCLPSRHCGANLAFEERFFQAEKDETSIYLVFYENVESIVLGKSLLIDEEVYLHKHPPPVYRRISGGGTVYHAQGNLNYAIFLSLGKFPELINVSLSYQRLLTAVADGIGPRVAIRGYSDLGHAVRGEHRKFSGNAQCRKRGWLMLHGTLVYNPILLRRIPWYLKMPPKQPAYRAGRSHRSFMTNVLPCYSRAILMLRIRQGLAHAFQATLKTVHPREIPGFAPLNGPFQPEEIHG